MNDEHDNALDDKEMLRRKTAGGVVKPNPIHTDPGIQHLDVRFYFGEEVDPAEMLDNISAMIQDSEMSCFLTSAYQLVNDGFAHLTPDSKPLA